jgi:hypothetical protein
MNLEQALIRYPRLPEEVTKGPCFCHTATGIWLYAATHGVGPRSVEDVAEGAMTPFFKKLMDRGTKVSRPMIGNATFTPGTVLIFEKNGGAGHSCIAKSSTKIWGYNQTSWYSVAGPANVFSEHDTSELKWVGAMHPHQIKTDRDHLIGHLYKIDQATAMDMFTKETIQKGVKLK